MSGFAYEDTNPNPNIFLSIVVFGLACGRPGQMGPRQELRVRRERRSECRHDLNIMVQSDGAALLAEKDQQSGENEITQRGTKPKLTSFA